MKSTFVNIAGKLPRGLVALYGNISDVAKSLDIDFLVVGAMARDLVLVHGFGSKIERGTRDVDFGIEVANWQDFETLKMHLVEQGFEPDGRRPHRLIRNDSEGQPWEVDIVPFGSIATPDARISWPTDQGVAMSVLGFAEALANALTIQVSESPDITIPVASPAGIALLKLVAWIDRQAEFKKKDAMDFAYLVESYSNIPEIYEALYEEGWMEAQDWDETKASALKLGLDAGAIAHPQTTTFLQAQLFDQPSRLEHFARDMRPSGHRDVTHGAELLGIFVDAFLQNQERPPIELGSPK